MKFLETLEILSPLYDVFILDIVGVLHNGVSAFPEVEKSLKEIGKINHFMVLSNMARPCEFAEASLEKKGITVPKERILTSGEVLRYQLRFQTDDLFKKIGTYFYHFGADKNPHLLTGLNLKGCSTLNKANFLLCTQTVGDKDSMKNWDSLLQDAIAKDLPMVVPNPDITAMHGSKTVWTPGSFGKRYENMGGKAYYYGKPSQSIYDEAFRMLDVAGFKDKKRFIMVGDTMETDILGAHNANIDSALVLSGNTALELRTSSDVHEEYILKKIKALSADRGYAPNWVLPSFKW